MPSGWNRHAGRTLYDNGGAGRRKAVWQLFAIVGRIRRRVAKQGNRPCVRCGRFAAEGGSAEYGAARQASRQTERYRFDTTFEETVTVLALVQFVEALDQVVGTIRDIVRIERDAQLVALPDIAGIDREIERQVARRIAKFGEFSLGTTL